MADIPLRGDGQDYEGFGIDTANTRGTAVASSSSVNTKGSYVQLIASTAFHASGLIIVVHASAATSKKFLIDFAIGAAASEQVIVADVPYCTAGGHIGGPMLIYLPIPIPAGTRISARCQSGSSSAQTVYLSATTIAHGAHESEPCGDCETLGSNTADSGATQVDPGGTQHTKGSYAQITSSTSFHAKYLILVVAHDGSGTAADVKWLFDVAIGAAASEQIIIPDLPSRANQEPTTIPNTSTLINRVHGPFPVSIPAGTRIAVRCQSDNNTVGDREADVAVILVG